VLPRAHRRVCGVGNFCNWVTSPDWLTPLVSPQAPRPRGRDPS
jgi:hypothetical protein